MDTDLKVKYDSTRDFSEKAFRAACYAPFSSLFFDTYGLVRVCCHNVWHKVGDISTQSIAEIWHGKQIAELREAMKQYDFGLGCQFCEWRMALGSFSSMTIRTWEELRIVDSNPSWPQIMEFAMSNTCNLECVMCGGYSSSAIRSHREHLPPLLPAYKDSFFKELDEFLPHLKRAKFYGGEPFLQRECFRIWESMIDQALSPACHVTTNGTQWNRRVERVLSRLPFDISISMDGLTKKTFESVRANASYEAVMSHFHAFHYYARTNHRHLGLTFCLMRQNWHEFPEFCAFAEEWGCQVFVNTVRRPENMSLYTLPSRELKDIVHSLEKAASIVLPTLKTNAPILTGELERLRSFLCNNPKDLELKILPGA
jgi:MoaA/NifB/PqqE/SkfB family radical SAM enzyme